MKPKDRVFHHDWEFARIGLCLALKHCKEDGYRPLYLPELTDKRIDSEKDSLAWKSGYQTMSLKVTAMTPHRSRVMLVAHCRHYFSSYEKIRQSLDLLVDGAGLLPKNEVERLIRLGEKGEEVVIIPYEKIVQARFGEQDLDSVMENPLFMAAMDNDLTRTEKYLKKYFQYRGKTISVLNLNDSDNAGRLLSLGYRSAELCSLIDFTAGGKFYAVPK